MDKLRKRVRKKGSMDFLIVFCIFVLTVLGVIMVFSASMYNASVKYDDAFYYLKKQLLYGSVGFFLMIFISGINYSLVKKLSFPVLAATIILLALVLVPSIGVDVNGARRWIVLFGIQIQPSEFVKIAVILYMAYRIENAGKLIKTFKYGVLPFIILTLVVCGLIALEPNLSTALVIAVLICGVLFISDCPMKYMGIFPIFACVGGVYLIVKTPWRLARIFSYLDPWADATGSGWQTVQSLMALGSGGIFGQGLGNGKAKLMFMPEPQNDFIFAHIGEELGLIGALMILGIYLLLIWRTVKVSLEAPDTFGCVFAGGMAILLGMQVFINIGVVTNLLPVTGMQLPFVSAGASSLISLMCGMGVVLNISKYCRLS